MRLPSAPANVWIAEVDDDHDGDKRKHSGQNNSKVYLFLPLLIKPCLQALDALVQLFDALVCFTLRTAGQVGYSAVQCVGKALHGVRSWKLCRARHDLADRIRRDAGQFRKPLD